MVTRDNSRPTKFVPTTTRHLAGVAFAISAALPTYTAALAQRLIWVPVAYQANAEAHEGLSVKPDPGPSITI
jgi:hypothetical protein